MTVPDPTYAELEIGLHRVQAGTRQVELRFTDPRDQGERPPVRGAGAVDPAALLALQHEPEAYGNKLAEQLFGDQGVRAAYGQIKTAVESSGLGLRVRLVVGPSVPELHALRWELLRDPDTGAALATSEKTLFSRFMVSHDWRPVRLRPKADLKALVAVASPSNLTDYQLAEIDVEGEIRRASESLARIDVEVAGRDQALTLAHLTARLRRGIDVLYLVCHGALIKGMPRLYLQKDDGTVDVVDGADLARRIRELREPPRLAVLASCQSAVALQGTDAAGRATAEASLAPRLAEAGVPAVVAMQGRISMATVKRLMPAFFEELLVDGRIDHAMAVARGAVRERPDHWMPALYLRLKQGLIWYQPGFAGERDELKKWKSIVTAVRRERFTPILGWGVNESLCGSPNEAARRLAERHRYPLERHQRGDLTKAAPHLRVDPHQLFAPEEAHELLKRQALERHAGKLEEDQKALGLAELLRSIGDRRRARGDDPYRILASLPARLYITANPDDLLRDALAGAGRQPDVVVCRWQDEVETEDYETDPSTGRPLVYHMLGHFDDEDSLVLTEDDYFDYLIGATENRGLVPEVVRHATAASALMFLGFRLTDWSFRVLFRIIMQQQGGARRKKFSHVAVQVDPEEQQFVDAVRARRYLESYFEESARISIYWGTAEDFLRELRSRLAAEET